MPKNHDFYGEWVRGYASEDYAAENQRLIALMERLSADYTEAKLQRLTDISSIARAMKRCSGIWRGTRRCKAMLEFQNVVFQYDSEDFNIIDGLSFHIAPGGSLCRSSAHRAVASPRSFA